MKTKMGRAALMVGLLGMLSLAWGCGGDDDDDDDGAGTGGGAGTTAGTSGAGTGGMAGGTAGTRAGTGGGGAGTGGSMAPVMCNGMMCPPVMSAQGVLPPCCDADSGGGCGATVSMMGECEATKQEGTLDTSCPPGNSVIGTEVPGCCKMGNKCGLMSMTLMGCVERTDYPTGFLMGGMKLDARMCGGGEMDGGM